jgi:hypothetical protein
MIRSLDGDDGSIGRDGGSISGNGASDFNFDVDIDVDVDVDVDLNVDIATGSRAETAGSRRFGTGR